VRFPGLLFDLSDDLENRRPVVFRAEMRPAGQGLKYDPLGYGKVTVCGRLPSSPGIELEGSSAVDARPLERAPDEPFLTSLGEEIAKTSYLSRLLVADLNRSVSPSP
jgi:hypothetical protein